MALKVGYVPEHFSTPLFLAEKHGFYDKQGVKVQFLPYPSGSGHMIQSLKDGTIDVAIGLTEAFVAGIGKGSDWYRIVGTYVESPLCWAISTGSKREDINSDNDIHGKTIGISRIGSGSFVMPYVLAQQQQWSKKFDFEILDNFKNLRDAVNKTGDVEPADAFMWEIFTTKKYYDNGELKKIGQIYTPWPSWVVTASSPILSSSSEDVKKFLLAVNEGIEYFNSHHDEAVSHIIANLDYNEQDARAWLKTVEFVPNTLEVNQQKILHNTISILKSAEVLEEGSENVTYLYNLGQ